MDRSYYMLPDNTPICTVECEKAFGGLTAKEQLYAHYMAQASAYGSLISIHQCSPEAPLIFLLLRKVFKRQTVNELKKVALEKAGLTEEDFKRVLIYAGGIFSNAGNYKGFGDSKFVPNLDKAKFEKFVRHTAAYENDKTATDFLLSTVLEKIFSLEERELRLEFGNQGITTYLSSNISSEDAKKIDRYMKSKLMEGWNTRLFKTIDGQPGKAKFEIRLASIDGGQVSGPDEFEGALVTVTRGDYAPLLERMNRYLELAKAHAANENEVKMLEKYIEHFKTGSLDLHKDGSRFWIKDKGPAVESYIGFIENYRDPAGIRSEFEGFVAVVNRSVSEKFGRLVDNAEKILSHLPWDPSYEKDKFLRPDFTSLDVLYFGSSGIPSGINIPNYDEIRQNEGFKNVSLGNVIAAMPKVKTTFLKAEDQEIYKKYYTDSFELQVGLHELLGHGSGKLFIKNNDGTFNFDVNKVKDMQTGEKITSWYEEGETYSTKFGALSSAYEECRAEAVGYYLCTFPDVMQIFGFQDKKKADVIKYANLLFQFRLGLVALEFYSPEKKAWGQAHCHARFVLLMVGIEAGQDFIQIKEFVNTEDGKPDLFIFLDESKIESVGKPAIGEFLKKLQLFKATGDIQKATALFNHYSMITDKVLHWREIAIARRQPRRMFVQANTILNNGSVKFNSYPESLESVVQSSVERYGEDKIEEDMMNLWKKDVVYFK